jgi:hypothetical protein
MSDLKEIINTINTLRELVSHMPRTAKKIKEWDPEWADSSSLSEMVFTLEGASHLMDDNLCKISSLVKKLEKGV